MPRCVQILRQSLDRQSNEINLPKRDALNILYTVMVSTENENDLLILIIGHSIDIDIEVEKCLNVETGKFQ